MDSKYIGNFSEYIVVNVLEKNSNYIINVSKSIR